MNTIMRRGSKGFFFTITILLLLLVISTSLYLWVITQNQQEKLMEDRYQYNNIETVFSLVSPENIREYTNVSLPYALYVLADYVSQGYYLKEDTGPSDNPGTGYVNRSVYSLFVNGYAPSEYFVSWSGVGLRYSENQSGYIFRNWTAKVNEICTQLGCECNISDPYDFNLEQIDPWTVRASFRVTSYARCGDSYVEHPDIPVNITFNITGYPDPMISSYMVRVSSNPDARRQVFPHPVFGSPEEIGRNLSIIAQAGDSHGIYKGKGFFYGPVIDLTDISHTSGPGWAPDTSGWYRSIFYGKWSDLSYVRSHGLDLFGAYIIHDATLNVTSEVEEEHEATGTFNLTYCKDLGMWVRPHNATCEIKCIRRYNRTTLYEPGCGLDCFNISATVTWDEFEMVSTDPDCTQIHICHDVIGHVVATQSWRDVWLSDDYADEREALCNSAAPVSTGSSIIITNITDKPFIVMTGRIDSDEWSQRPEHFPDDLVRDNPGVLIDNWADVNITDLAFTDPLTVAGEEFSTGVIEGMGTDNHWVMDIESLRDMMGCSWYVKYKEGPSYFQRFLKDGYKKSSRDYGITSFMIGTWTMGDGETYNCSNVDYEFFRCVGGEPGYSGVKVLGMPGNKFKAMCEMTSPIGHFRLVPGDGLTNMYTNGLKSMLLGDDGVSCE